MEEFLHGYPLDCARRDIRLLTILPAWKSEAPMRCSLRVASLDTFPEYEAISYVWGDIRERNDILLDGQTIPVPRNVRRILQRLRFCMKRRVIWIDFVCINQDDVAEKNSQVPLMSVIYANATSILAIISLDNLCDNAADAMKWRDMSDVESRKWKDACWNILDFDHHFWLAEYWTRMWTFQEYRLSRRKPPICICGDVEFPAKTEFDRFWTCYEATDQLFKMHSKVITGRRMRLEDHYVEMKAHRKDLLEETSSRKCQNLKDKIYALYGLLPSLQREYPPDYNKSLCQIIFETAKHLLQERFENIVMLDRFCLRKDRLENVSIPSWVPDLTTTVKVSTANEWASYSKRLSPCGDIQPVWQPRCDPVTEDPSVLRISGRLIGKCRSMFQFASDVKSVLAQMKGVIKIHGDGRHVWDNVWEPENIPHRFLRACGVFSNYSHAVFDINHPKFSLTRLRTVFETLDLIHQDADTILETFAEAGFKFLGDLEPRLYGIKVFTIHHASFIGFGLSEHSVEDNDQVIVSVCQLRIPMVLRQSCGDQYGLTHILVIYAQCHSRRFF
ncbi:heterokaryon incompatibility protein-domain-containing protein [Aspergillus pseudonomiae]|uniref:Heterokaryon incompatibility protein-domain-containing protein n=1 Tax=Aspergillus pseudonomiae TaxID=1506151 RepID=A0A5N7DR81_9EURO|nr:heterokaryon incompatibility protein-domain-containing protein [Aspergillus pseudonomiae]KAE8408896.1 heterokaryon incompatibility protein-domain-containing protein [Aspergillus pseudonomiae]